MSAARPPLASDRVRPREPDEMGFAERAGRHTWWESWGSGEEAVYLLPPWNFQHSMVWQSQVPVLARHVRVLTSDPLGNGRSDRARDPERVTPTAIADDCAAVMDAAGVSRAVVVAHSRGAQWGLELAARHPERVRGAVLLAPLAPATPSLMPGLLTHPALMRFFTRPTPVKRWWARMNAPYWREDFDGFAHWFARRALSTPHSETLVADAVEFAHDGDVESMIAATLAPLVRGRRALGDLTSRVSCPVLVIHGGRDRIVPAGDARWVAGRAGGRTFEIPVADHCPHGRAAPVTNEAIVDHAMAALGRTRVAPPVHRGTGRRRVLFLSSPIGLGHARRDLAIARALRERVEGVEVVWLTQHPTTHLLEREGELVHPASALLANECAVIEAETRDHSLDAFRALRRSDAILAANYQVFLDVVREERYDLWVGDEAWELDHFLHEFPEHKRAPYAFLTDFVGLLPTPDDDARERELIADRNALMVAQVRGAASVRDAALYIGDVEDCVDLPLGPGLPTVREWVQERFTPVGYVLGGPPAANGARSETRSALGWSEDEKVCIVAVGGSGAGRWLLRRATDAFEVVAGAVPGLRMLAVGGPRIADLELPPRNGLELTGYVHGLDRMLACADVAVVQGGLATTMELGAAGVPFVQVPLDSHFEQQIHVDHRLRRHDIGRRLDAADCHDAGLARAITDALVSRPRPLELDGEATARAAAQLAALL